MATTKKKSTTKKDQITANQYGRNIVMIIDGNKVSKAFKEKAKRDEILEMVEAYNKRNSKKKLNDIIEFMSKEKKGVSSEATEAKEKITKAKKKPKKAAVKKFTLEEARRKLEADGYTVSKQAPKSRRYGGEY